MSVITILLIAVVALLAGMEGVLDQFQFHQPIVACTLIGLVSGYLKEGIILGGSLQMIALGWANVGAAIAPDAALASVASAIIMVKGLGGGNRFICRDHKCDRSCDPIIRSGIILNDDLPYVGDPDRSFYGQRCRKGQF